MAKKKTDPNELVRAAMPSGGENTVRRSYAEKHGLEIKEGKPLTRRGRPIGFKPKNSLPSAGDDQGQSTASGDPVPPNNGSGAPPALTS